MSRSEDIVELELPASARYLSLMRSIISELPELDSIKPAVVEDIKVAVIEALTNVIKHSSERVSRIGFVFSFVRGEIHVSVRYADPNFKIENIPGPDAQPELEKLPESGWGLFMMRKLMDHVEYLVDGSGDVELRMIRTLQEKKSGNDDTV